MYKIYLFSSFGQLKNLKSAKKDYFSTQANRAIHRNSQYFQNCTILRLKFQILGIFWYKWRFLIFYFIFE